MHGFAERALRGRIVGALVVAGWLVVWQFASALLGQPLILPGPVEVARALAGLLGTAGFWGKVGFSFARIAGGCALAYVCAGALAALAHRSRAVRAVLAPPMLACKATPVACVVVLLLMWLGAANVSFAAVFIMALPGVYFAALEGLGHVDEGLSELLLVMGVRGLRRFLVLTWRGVLPFLVAASEVVVGMAWKAGVAAELIGTPLGSIGERIYQAKLLLDTAGLFAWTVAVVALATLCERAVLAALRASGPWAIRRAVALRSRGQERDAAPERLLVRGLALPHGAAGGHPVTLDVPAAGRLCVMGPSGEGKTTLLRVLCGLDDPFGDGSPGGQRGMRHGTRGHGTRDGALGHGTQKNRPKRAQGGQGPDGPAFVVSAAVAMEFQDARLVEDASAFQNVALTAAPWRGNGELRALLAKAVPGINADAPVSSLSGGQRRRVELVRALASPGSLVLLDEPFAGLDERAHEEACALIASELRGRTLVVATHDARDAGLLGARAYHLDNDYEGGPSHEN